MMPDLTELIDKHRALDVAIKNNREDFLSDWDGGHPFVKEFLGPEFLNPSLTQDLPSRYIYFEDEPSVLEAVRVLHFKLESLDISCRNIAAGPGSSSLLVALSLWLVQQGYKEVYYVPPLYYTFHFFLRMLNIRLRPVSGKQVFESGAALNLPSRKTVLLLCDPVWYAGRRVPLDKIVAIADWQKLTGSLVFVDGSFQFMQWNGTRREHTAMLDSDLTFRLISPTKALAIPFLRFAYLLHPSRFHDDFVFLYESIVGGASICDYHFAQRSLDVLSSERCNRDLTVFLRSTYQQLIEKRLIDTQIAPEAGYFIFAVPKVRLPNQVVMGQDYFELKNYPDHVRVNLLGAAQRLIGQVGKGDAPGKLDVGRDERR